MKRRFFIILFLMIWIFLLPSKVFSQDNEDVRTVDTEGSSIIINDDLAGARNNAIQNALQKAVEHIVITLIPTKTAANQSQIIRENLYAKSNEYIHDYRIISEKQIKAVYQVNVRSTLFASSIRDDLQAHGLLGVEKKRVPVTAVVVIVRGLKSYTDYVKVKELLKTKMKVVMGIYQRSFEWGTARMDLEIQGSVQSLSGELVKTGHFSLDTTRTDQNYIEVTFLR